MKTIELTGAALDWAVARAAHPDRKISVFARHVYFHSNFGISADPFMPSLNWAQGGPIVERESIWIRKEAGTKKSERYWVANEVKGPSPLIAAMRYYVLSKLGDEVEIPNELT